MGNFRYWAEKSKKARKNGIEEIDDKIMTFYDTPSQTLIYISI